MYFPQDAPSASISFGAQLGPELGIEVTAPRSYERITYSRLVMSIADGDNLSSEVRVPSRSLAGRSISRSLSIRHIPCRPTSWPQLADDLDN